MEQPIFPRDENQVALDAHHFGTKDMDVIANGEGGCTSIFPMVQKHGQFISAELATHLSTVDLLAPAESYFEGYGRFMCVHVKTTSAESNKIVLRCHGFFTEVPVPTDIGFLKMRFILTFILNRKNTGETCNTFVIDQEVDMSSYRFMLQEQDAGIERCMGNEGFIECELPQEGSLLRSILSAPQDPSFVLNGTVKVVFSCEDQRLRRLPILDQICDPSSNTDFAIVANNGAEKLCHKLLLVSQSSVLSRNLGSGMLESIQNKLTMTDMTENGVDGFLGYLYERDLRRPSESSKIAFELLQAGEKYDIPELKSKMKAIILQKPNEWFDEDVGLRLFAYVRSLSDCEDIKQKAVQVMKPRKEHMMASKVFQDFFKDNHLAALELATFFISV